MTKEEALVFLELPATATAADIKTRIEEKLAFYELQSEKAPTDFLRRLNLRNLGKVKNILHESAPWTAPRVTEEAPAVPVEETIEEPPLTVYIVPSMKEAALKQADSREIEKKRKAGEPLGWLIRHTENMPANAFPLQAGNNFLGRKLQAGMAPFIVIDGDEFISRVQCVIYAEEEPMAFFISDPSAFNKGKTSKNGSFINGNKTPVTEKTQLYDGDTIQLGVTKLLLRFNKGERIADMIEEVAKAPYSSTVVLDGQ